MGSDSRYDRETMETGWKGLTLFFVFLFMFAIFSGLYDDHLKKIKSLPGNWEADPTEYGDPQWLRIETGANGRLMFIAGDRESPASYRDKDSWLDFSNTITITGYEYEISTELIGNDKLRCRFTHNYIPHHEVIYHRLPETQILGPIFPRGKHSPGMVSQFEMALPANFNPKKDVVISPVTGFVASTTWDGDMAEVITINPFPSLMGIKGNDDFPMAKGIQVNIGHIDVQTEEHFVRKGDPIGLIPMDGGGPPGRKPRTVSYRISFETRKGPKSLGPGSLPNSLRLGSQTAP